MKYDYLILIIVSRNWDNASIQSILNS